MSTQKTEVMVLKEAMDSIPALSLRKIALATDVTYGVLLKASKKPIAGVLYDPEAFNYDEVARTLQRRGVQIKDLNFEEIAGKARPTALKPVDIKQGEQYTLRGNDSKWIVTALTSTHICLQNAEITDEGDVLRAMSIATFLHQTPKLVTIDPKDPNTDVEATEVFE